jgi:hypothetical protein
MRKEKQMTKITWDFVSPRGEHWLEWSKDGVRHLKIVTEEEYNALTANNENDLDFLN